ncbi:hypothetical protein AAK706_05665 [Erysipelotrichaceae bacterium 66-17]
MDNYKIINTGDSELCFIFCSSNNIYYPDTEEEIVKTIFEKDRYEWERISQNIEGKKIFLRDILKAWYAHGINMEINSIDKIVLMLKRETSGYKIVTVGNSAGGYLALLLGAMLDAEYSIVFSPQNNLKKYDPYWKCPFLSKEFAKKNSYLDLSEIIKNQSKCVFYFYSAFCQEDVIQANYIKKNNDFYVFPMNSKWHGKNIYNFNMKTLLTLSPEQLIELNRFYKSKKFINKISFSIHLDGIIFTLKKFLKTR